MGFRRWTCEISHFPYANVILTFHLFTCKTICRRYFRLFYCMKNLIHILSHISITILQYMHVFVCVNVWLELICVSKQHILWLWCNPFLTAQMPETFLLSSLFYWTCLQLPFSYYFSLCSYVFSAARRPSVTRIISPHFLIPPFLPAPNQYSTCPSLSPYFLSTVAALRGSGNECSSPGDAESKE